jgi:O-antigen/teichoic acid export membrane protein
MLAINFIFVPRYGYMACAWGGFAGYGTCMVLSYIVGQIKSPIPYNLGAIFGYFALALLLYYFSILFRPHQQGWVFVVNTLLLLVYVAVIIYNERELVRRTLSGFRQKVLHR